MMPRLVLLRHGESLWNRENRFTGWIDVGLTEHGMAQGKHAARLLRREGLDFDICFTSVLTRAIKTLHICLEEMDRLWLPVHKSWRLNERHYGALQGLNKAETAAKHGDEQVHIWRRSYAVRPPALEPGDDRFPGHDRRYADVDPAMLPRTESLKDTVERVLPYWHEAIAPQIRLGRRVLIAAHGNSLRGLVKFLDGISDEEIPKLEIPTGVPIVYDLDEDVRPLRRRQLEEA